MIFHKNADEPCVCKKTSGSVVVFLVLYVDDILLSGNDISLVKIGQCDIIDTIYRYNSCPGTFSLKDLGEATYILGIKIYRDKSKRLLSLSQSTYIDKILKRFSMEQSKRVCPYG